MKRGTRDRVLGRIKAAKKLSPSEAKKFHSQLVDKWIPEYLLRIRRSLAEAESFRKQKKHELRQFAASDETIARFLDACADIRRRFSAPQCVPTHLISNYEAVEVFRLREMRRR